MQQSEDPSPVVATYREIASLFNTPGAAEALAETARPALESAGASEVDEAAAHFALRRALDDLKRARQASGAGTEVLTTPHNAVAARLQTLLASGELAPHGEFALQPLASGGLEAKFDTGDVFGWASVVWQKLKSPGRYPIIRPAPVPEPIPDNARIAVLGDWGTGLYGAPAIAQSIMSDPDRFDVVLHLGDVYYSGSKSEVTERFLHIWPFRAGALSRALNSNHEMYSGGKPYFTQTLPLFGQAASYFALQNKNWTLVGLDTGHTDHAVDDEQAEWLDAILQQADDRRVVLFSHHQLYSHFESQGDTLAAGLFGAILKKGRIFAWYWGHEHRCAIFKEPDREFGILARCIGHGGMPQNRDATRGLPPAPGFGTGGADWRLSKATERGKNLLSDVYVLDGRNPYIIGEEDVFSPHGYAVLTLDGRRLVEEVVDPKRQTIYRAVL